MLLVAQHSFIGMCGYGLQQLHDHSLEQVLFLDLSLLHYRAYQMLTTSPNMYMLTAKKSKVASHI